MSEQHDSLENWLTMTEAAVRSGCTRAAVYAAAKNGKLEVRSLSNRFMLVHCDELARWAATRKGGTPQPAGLSARQAEVLLALYRGGGPGREALHDYSHYVPTVRALGRRGLVERSLLTEEGKTVARGLLQQLGEQLASGNDAA